MASVQSSGWAPAELNHVNATPVIRCPTLYSERLQPLAGPSTAITLRQRVQKVAPRDKHTRALYPIKVASHATRGFWSRPAEPSAAWKPWKRARSILQIAFAGTLTDIAKCVTRVRNSGTCRCTGHVQPSQYLAMVEKHRCQTPSRPRIGRNPCAASAILAATDMRRVPHGGNGNCIRQAYLGGISLL